MKRMIALLLVLASTALAAEEKESTDPWALAAAGDYRGVKEALDAYPTLIRMSDDKGFTLLHAAVKGKQLRVAKLLISRGAFVNAVDARQYTPLLVAADVGLHQLDQPIAQVVGEAVHAVQTLAQGEDAIVGPVQLLTKLRHCVERFRIGHRRAHGDGRIAHASSQLTVTPLNSV